MTAKLYNSSADKQRAYRRRLREQGKSTDGRKRFDRLIEYCERNPAFIHKKNTERYFVAIDGEGINRGEEHLYCLLGDSKDRYIEDYRKGLATHDCFEFLLDCAKGKSIVVGYSIGYDINMILKDCSGNSLARLSSGLRATQELGNGGIYKIEWLPGKSLKISRLNRDYSIDQSVLVYDVFGFFQKAFVKTATEFDVITNKEKEFLSEMKLDRSNFKAKDKAKIREYNLLECRVLVRIMDQLRDAMKIAECVPDRWNGAGAIAAKMLKDHGLKEKNYTPEKMLKYFLGAYYGGRIQILEMGEHHNIYTHDVVSAYPSALYEMPSSIGTWRKTKVFKPGKEWAFYIVEWDVKKGVIAPFPFRSNDKGTRLINYPTKGKGVYWYPEVLAAIKHYPKEVKIHYGYVLSPEETDVFRWIKPKFEARKRFKNSNDNREKLANVPLKLGLNSLYGKNAQGIGFRGNPPPYQNYFWAGWTTSKTRARMFELAMQKPEDIIAFATDGVFSRSKLAENGENLGDWEVKESGYLFILKAGLYAFGKSSDLLCHNNTDDPKQCQYLCDHESMKSRGHFLKDVPFTKLQELWRSKGQFATYNYKTTKFFGLKISIAQDFTKWRRWIEVPRTINFFPGNQIPIAPEKIEIRKRLNSYQVSGCSLPYEPKGDWYEGEEGRAYLDELDQLDSFYD